jgi:hypothetical protein
MGMLQSITRLPNGMIGVAAGHFDGLEHVHRVGAVPSMSQGQSGTVWDVDDTDYPWASFSAANTLTIDRDSASDADKIVLVEGLDENYHRVSEEVTLTNATGNATTQSFIRVQRASLTNGSSINAGDITVNKSTTTVAKIVTGQGMSLMAIYTVPAGYTGYLLQGACTCQAGADATGNMFVRYFGNDSFTIGHAFEVSGTGGQYYYPFLVPLSIPEKSDIDVRVKVRSNNARLTAAFCVLLEAN